MINLVKITCSRTGDEQSVGKHVTPSYAHILTVLLASLGGGALIGCVRVPSYAQPTNVPVSAVVKRVKCDVEKIIYEKTTTDEYKDDYSFLKRWAAKVHLTMIMDNTAAITPGVLLTNPLHNAYVTSVGPATLGGSAFPATAQNFTLGLGAGLTTEAVRTEDLEFFLSFAEMKKEFSDANKERKYGNCDSPDNMLLDSDLGLKEWVNAALEPVQDKFLTVGPHPPLAANPTPIPTAPFQRTLNEIQALKIQPPSYGPGEEVPRDVADIAQAKALLDKAKQFVDQIAKPLADEAASHVPECSRVIGSFKDAAVIAAANAAAASLSMSPGSDTTSALVEVRKYAAQAESAAQNVLTTFNKCQNNKPPTPTSKVAVYDPEDLISHQVNFYVTATGSVAPQLKLVQVTASTFPALFSATRKNTNTLIVVFGSPATAPDGSTIASPAMNNQIQAALISQAVTSALH